jgi:hypothetical protein
LTRTRKVTVAGLALLAGAVPVLARSTGVRPSAATWLAVLNPLVLINLIGGAHNNALMVGLLAAGPAVAIRHHPLATLIVAALVGTYRARLSPVYGLGIVLVALVAFGPAIRPWYVLWGLVPLRSPSWPS